MSKIKQRLLIAAAFLMIIGILIVSAVFISSDFDLNDLSTTRYVSTTSEIKDPFANIIVNADTAGIEFIQSNDKQCRIICCDDDKITHQITVQDKTLTIDTVDDREWFEHIGISFSDPQITICLPENEYDSLAIDSKAGDIILPDKISFKSISISGSSGDVTCGSSVSRTAEIKLDTGNIFIDCINTGDLNVASATGSINIESSTAEGKINIESDTGTVNIKKTTCKGLSAKSETGAIVLQNTIAENNLNIEANTGDVLFENSDAGSISIVTNTGNVSGSILSEKIFLPKTSTGSVDVPKTSAGGRCEITTSTGDIKVNISSTDIK